jgi:anti-sigma B factor antagonist
VTASSLDRPSSELVTIDVSDLGPAVRLTAAGEIDSTSAPVLKDRVDALLDADVVELTVDLTGVTFLDSAGLCVLAAAYRRATSEQRRIRVLASSRAVIRPLQITGLWDLLQVEKVVPGSDSAA